jgi:predicted glutamine amidotransferase
MCIAILNTKNTLKEDYINNSWENNNQGAGLLYNENGKLVTFKTYKKKEFKKEYYKVRNRISGKIVLHFRIATSGHTPYVNLHPFLVNDNLGFVHNGIISNLGDDKFSDTYYFNEMLKTFQHDFINCKTTIEIISKFIGSSKLIFLDSNDNHTIVNEKNGHWKEGNWFSNNSYESYADYYYFGNKKVSKNNYAPKTDDFYNKLDMYDNSKEKLTNSDLAEYLQFYSNTYENNISYLAELLKTDQYTMQFINQIEDIAWTINSFDIHDIIDYVLEEQYSQKYDEEVWS